MKAIAKCPNCKKTITTDCRGCIDGETSCHGCECGDVINKIKWKKVPETESELKEIEQE